MDLNVFKNLIEPALVKHSMFVNRCRESEKYYRNSNDILTDKAPGNYSGDDHDNPLRNADNRVPHNFHGLLVNQKASYMFTYPPTFDVGDDNINELIANTLGDDFPLECLNLCVDASNCSRAWLHVWIDGEDNTFKYSTVDPKEVIPIYSGDLKKSLLSVVRTYTLTSEEDGLEYDIFEYWDKESCTTFRKEHGKGIDNLSNYNNFVEFDINTLEEVNSSNTFEHNFGVVPFIEFPNNNIGTDDLKNIKQLIDIYDKVFSGYVNDLEDIQEIIFVLTNYGGTDLKEFLHGLKKYKTVDMQNSGGDDKSGLSTLSIDIPVEAREKLLDRTRKLIFELGQGVDPNPENFGNSSGVALEYLYSLLELKSGFTEVQFKPAFNKLIRLICGNLKVGRIVQTWTRNKIRNDKETSEIAKMSQGVISTKTLLKNHPWVDDVDLEEAQLKEEENNFEELFNKDFMSKGMTGNEEE